MGELETMEGVSCAAAKAAALRVLRVPELAGKMFLEGGLVPWVLGGRESGRPHGDIDFSVRLEDMPVVRAWLAREGRYDRDLDSRRMPCNADGEEYGSHKRRPRKLLPLLPSRRRARAAKRRADGFRRIRRTVRGGHPRPCRGRFRGDARASRRRARRVRHVGSLPCRQSCEQPPQRPCRHRRARSSRLRRRTHGARRARLRRHGGRLHHPRRVRRLCLLEPPRPLQSAPPLLGTASVCARTAPYSKYAPV